jgi:hypothetical protein
MANYGRVTEEMIKKALEDMVPDQPKFVIYQGCLDRGITKRTEWDAGLCDNPECISCRDFEEGANRAMIELGKKYRDGKA